MREFEKWSKTPTGFAERESDYAEGGAAWRAALEWYQSIAAKCEKDCQTDKDYKTLYFHLKQVLENEVGEPNKDELQKSTELEKFFKDYSYYVGVEITCKRMPMEYSAWVDKRKMR